MKKFLSILFCAVWLAGCSLNIPLEDEIAGLDAIDDVDVAREAMGAVYYGYPKLNMELSVFAEDFFPTALISNDQDLADRYAWKDEQIVQISDNAWNDYYSALANANILLNSEPYIKIATDAERAAWETIKGEACAMKALIYFDLLNLYSDRYAPANPGIILKDRFVIESPERTPAGECVAVINSLLEEARRLLAGKKSDPDMSYYINYHAVVLLSARVALYTGDTDAAEAFCTTLIADKGFSSETPDVGDYTNLWQNGSSSEKLFAFFNETQMNLSSYTFNQTRGDYIALPVSFDFAEGDVRAGIASFSFEMRRADNTTPVFYNLMGKYRSDIHDFGYRNINSLRLAEAYFILAECQAADGDDDKARETVNKLLRRRGAGEIDAAVTGDQLKERIFAEKQREFVGEGLNFFDLKRTGRNMRRFARDNSAGVVEATIDKGDYRWLWPLPLKELQENRSAVQNPGWQGAL